jgi:hypothetical protein
MENALLIFQDFENSQTYCRSVIEMHRVENLFCVVCVHQFQEAKGPETELITHGLGG